VRSAPLVFDLCGFVRDCKNAVGDLNCEDYITARLRHEDEEVLLYADRNITIFLVQFSANVQYPPHNHNMAANIALCHGTEIAT
jgi:predicted metal-dependent enzyme (double-stranded beta helix superfamily)